MTNGILEKRVYIRGRGRHLFRLSNQDIAQYTERFEALGYSVQFSESEDEDLGVSIDGRWYHNYGASYALTMHSQPDCNDVDNSDSV